MELASLRRYGGLGLIGIPFVVGFIVLGGGRPELMTEVATPTVTLALSTATAPLPYPSPSSTPTASTAVQPLLSSPTPTTALAATTSPTARLTPTPRPEGTPPRVGLQVGHWKSNELPDELARLRTSTGAFHGEYSEVEINYDIAQRVGELLTKQGVVVDILPATIPIDYDADAFVAIHADGSQSRGAHGFKIATPWRTSRAGQHLLEALTAEYAATTGMPWDNVITFNMKGYYAFNYRRHDHAIKSTTPAVIVEMGFLTSPIDRALLIQQPDVIARGIFNGIMRYLSERDPNDGAALLPPEYRNQRPRNPEGVDVRSEPRDDAPIVVHADAERRFNPLQERDGWFQVFVRDGERRLLGWVRKDLLIDSSDPTPTPMPSTDS